MRERERDGHEAIAHFASSAIAHHSIHRQLFGAAPESAAQRGRIRWAAISEAVEQSHFLRDWKLSRMDSVIRRQINILQALIAANATPKNNLSSNSYTASKEDFVLNRWKLHIVKLRALMLGHCVHLESPMDVLRFDRTEIDYIAKISAMNGIQHLIEEARSGKPPLPRSAFSSPTTSL